MTNSMRVDSCRKCGQELQTMQLCSICDQPSHFECNNCIMFVDDPIHQHENLSQSFFQYYGNNTSKRRLDN